MSMFLFYVTFFEKKGNQRNFFLLYFVSITGGDDGIRTHDPLLAGQVLSQLSYTPIKKWFVVFFTFFVELSSTGRPKWTRTTDLVLIRHAL